MNNPKSPIPNPKFATRRAFTLMELLIVIMIIAILAAMSALALAGAAQQARADRTRAIVNKIDQLIRDKYESYRTRAVPIRVPPELSRGAQGGIYAARLRLYALRELMRLELPDRISDLCTDAELTDVNDGTLDTLVNHNDARRNILYTTTTTTPAINIVIPMPAVAKTYKRHAQRIMNATGSGWSTAHQGAECLYLILSTIKDGDKSALDFFTSDEIGDVDEDGFKEILDGWGSPIAFLRWAPGYIVENNAVTMQTSDSKLAPDPFDPLHCDPRWSNNNPAQHPYALFPLIYSAGRDKVYDTNGSNVVYSTTAGSGNVVTWTIPPSDPYGFTNSPLVGAPLDGAGDGLEEADNITNHYQPTP